MDNKAKDIKLVKITELKSHPKNPNKHSQEQIDRLAKIIEYQGFRQPIVVSNLSGFIISGHGRLMAAKKLGYTEVPVIYEDFKDSDQEYAHLVADNAINQWAELEFSEINLELESLGPDLDIEMLGLKDFLLEPQEKFIEKDLWTETDFNINESYKIIIALERPEYQEEIFSKLGIKKISKRTGKITSIVYPPELND